jgi:hypothetical protein
MDRAEPSHLAADHMLCAHLAGTGSWEAALRAARRFLSAQSRMEEIVGHMQIARHGLPFFFFRNAGAGAGNSQNLNENQGPGQPDAPGAHHSSPTGTLHPPAG